MPVLPAALIAATATLCGSAVADPTIACAAPDREWDIGKYDQCVHEGVGKGYTDEEWENHLALCCWASGRDWSTQSNQCVAPPCGRDCEAAERPGWTSPGGMPDAIPTHTFEPA